MNHFIIRIEQILLLALSIALLLSHWHTLKAKIRKLRQLLKDHRPRKWKPRSPRDCPNCQSGISLAIPKPNSGVVPYAQRKSTRGCKKGISTQGHACPNPNCDCFGDHRSSHSRARWRWKTRYPQTHPILEMSYSGATLWRTSVSPVACTHPFIRCRQPMEPLRTEAGRCRVV